MSTVVHQLGVKIHSKIEGEKHLLAAAWESDKPLVNFAPYGMWNILLLLYSVCCCITFFVSVNPSLYSLMILV